LRAVTIAGIVIRKIALFLWTTACAVLIFFINWGAIFGYHDDSLGLNGSKKTSAFEAKSVEVEKAAKIASKQTKSRKLYDGKNQIKKTGGFFMGIPNIGLLANVVAVAVDNAGRMDVPNNYTEIGWFKDSAIPGNPGSAVFVAHVGDGASISGVFKNLKLLEIGDVISVSKSSKNLNFKVIEKKIYKFDDANTKDIFFSNNTSRIVLITCHGAWKPQLGTFEERLVIIAERVN